eukprot:8357691-Pyramimonas_sp.AAC.1
MLSLTHAPVDARSRGAQVRWSMEAAPTTKGAAGAVSPPGSLALEAQMRLHDLREGGVEVEVLVQGKGLWGVGCTLAVMGTGGPVK